MTEIKLEIMDIDVLLNNVNGTIRNIELENTSGNEIRASDEIRASTINDTEMAMCMHNDDIHSTEQYKENLIKKFHENDFSSNHSNDSKDSDDFLQDEDPFNYESSIIFEENSTDEHLEQSIESIIAKNTDDELKNLIDNLITNEKTAPNLIQKDILKDQSIKNVIIFFNKIVKEIYQNIINEKLYKYSYEYKFDKKLILNTDKIFRKKLKYTLKYYYEDQLGFNVSWNSDIQSCTLKLILKWD